MLAATRSSDGAFPLVLVTTLTCLAVMFWRVTLLVISVVVVTLLVYGVVTLRSPTG
jgi:hypothetical protein